MNKLIFKLFGNLGNPEPKSQSRKFLAFLRLSISVALAAFALAALSGCTPKAAITAITGNTAAIPNETAENPEVYFCPRDDCGKAIELLIKSANSSVHCALYDIDLRNVIGSLAGKSKSIDVKVVMDNLNQKGQVKGNGVRIDNDEQLMHDKFCVIDGNAITTGSFNPTFNDNYQNNNNMVVVYSRALAGNYESEFEKLWDGDFSKGSRAENPIVYVNGIEMENYFCPQDKCSSHVIGLIKGARSSVYFMSFSFTSEEIANALIAKSAKSGIDVRGIFDAQQSSSRFSQMERLRQFGIQVEKYEKGGRHKMHHKVFIIDNQTVITGSFNPTISADTKNDENLLVIHGKGIAEEFLKEFDSLWSP